MSSQHKAPLAAFVVVSIALIVVVANAMHNDASALATWARQPAQSLVSRLTIVARPHVLAAHEARAVVKAKAGLAAAPTVVEKVAGTAGGTSTTHRSSKRTHRARAGAQVVAPAPAAPVAASVPATASVPVKTPPAIIGTPPQASAHGNGQLGAPQQWQVHGDHPLAWAPGQVGHQIAAAPSVGKGWTRETHRGHGSHSQTEQHTSAAASSRSHQASAAPTTWSTGGRSTNGWGNGWGNGWSNGWSNGHSNGHSNGSSRGHGWGHGRH